MQHSQKQSLKGRFEEYQASKTALFWACAGSVIVATVVGFTWGGWVTGGSAQKMAESSAGQARQEVAAVVCVDRFMAAPDAGVQLTALKAISSTYTQAKFVQEGGWATIMPDRNRDDRKAATLCSQELATRDLPMIGQATQISDEVTLAQ